jgi:hypothetical protein
MILVVLMGWGLTTLVMVRTGAEFQAVSIISQSQDSVAGDHAIQSRFSLFFPEMISFSIGYSKLANILFAKHLQTKFNEEGIEGVSVSVHPGSVKTGEH